jgi:hypothetical protein
MRQHANKLARALKRHALTFLVSSSDGHSETIDVGYNAVMEEGVYHLNTYGVTWVVVWTASCPSRLPAEALGRI